MSVARALGTYAHDSAHSHFIAANQRFAGLLYSVIARAHCECSVRSPAQKDCRHCGECDARREHPRCPLGPNGDLGSSRLEEQLGGKITPSHAHSKEALCGLGAAYSAEWPQAML